MLTDTIARIVKVAHPQKIVLGNDPREWLNGRETSPRPLLLDLAIAFRIGRTPGGVAQPGQSSGFISRVSLVQIQSPLLDTSFLPNAS